MCLQGTLTPHPFSNVAQVKLVTRGACRVTIPTASGAATAVPMVAEADGGSKEKEETKVGTMDPNFCKSSRELPKS